MARTVAQIQAQMDAEQALQPELSGLNSISQVAIYTLWKYVMSVIIFFEESLWDLLKTEIETTISTAVVGTDEWVKQEALKFQYSTVTPQVVQLVDFVPSYNPVDETLQIITRASVATLVSQTVSVKVAKSDPPVKLAALELSSFEAYLDDIGFAGVRFNVQSLDADLMFLEAEIFYDGQYASTISADVIAAINLYLANLPFDGFIRISDVEDAIQSVTGVIDIVIDNLALRADGVPFGSKVFLVQNKTTLTNKLLTASGYAIEEDTAGETFTDKLTFTPES